MPAAVPLSREVERRVLDAARACYARRGFAKVTIDDIVAESQVSRATIYRLFPGGREVLFEAMRVRELERFFASIRAELDGVDALDDVVVRAVVAATRELRADTHLAALLASAPGEALGQLTVEGFPRIVRMATVTLTPFVARFVPPPTARRLIDVLARLTISYFLAPSSDLDLGDPHQARGLLHPVVRVLAAGTPAPEPALEGR